MPTTMAGYTPVLSSRLLIGMGEQEANHPSQMSQKAKQMHARLSALGHPGLFVEYREYRDEFHISVLPVLISQAIRFAARKKAVRG